MEHVQKEKVRAFERHAQTALVVLVVGLLGWIANTVQTTTVKLAGMSATITSIEVRLQDTKAGKLSSDETLVSIKLRLQAVENEIQRLREDLKNGNSE